MSPPVEKVQGTEFVINPWKLELVRTFFRNKDEEGEVSKKPPFVLEDCDVSSICVPSDADTTNDDEIGKTDVIAPSLGRGRLKNNILNSMEQVVQCLPISSSPISFSRTVSSSSVSTSPVSFIKQTSTVDSLCGVIQSTPSTTSPSKKSSPKPVAKSSNQRLISIDSKVKTSEPPVVLVDQDDLKEEQTEAVLEKKLQGWKVTAGKQIVPVRPVMVPSKNMVVDSCAAPDRKNAQDKQVGKQIILESNVAQVKQDATGVVLESRSERVDLATPAVLSVPVSDNSAIVFLSVAATESSIRSSASQVTACELVGEASPITSTRPVLVRKTTPKKVLPISTSPPVPPKVSSDQGRNCVSVILKSSRLSPKSTRLNVVLKKHKLVSEVVTGYSLKYSHASSPGVQVRLDYCFHQAEAARQFFKSVYSLGQAHSSPRLLTCILLSEEELGYQHPPVLTEHDLLAIQSSEYCRNIFRTSILIKVVLKEDMVNYNFKTVTDVNRFLFNKSSSVNNRSLGLLRKNVVPKRLVADCQGFFRLFTAGIKISEKIGKKHRFRVDGPYLLFSSKLDLFKFLVSEDASEIEHLQFDEKKVKEFVNVVRKKTIIHETVERADIYSCELNSEESNNSCEKNVDECEKNAKIVIEGNVGKVENANASDTIAQDCSPKILKVDFSYNGLFNDKVKLEVEGISVLGNGKEEVKKTENPEEEKEELVASVIAQKEEEISNLRKKLHIKEKMIQTEIMEKTAARSSLKEALSQLDQINQLSHMMAGKPVAKEDKISEHS